MSKGSRKRSPAVPDAVVQQRFDAIDWKAVSSAPLPERCGECKHRPCACEPELTTAAPAEAMTITMNNAPPEGHELVVAEAIPGVRGPRPFWRKIEIKTCATCKRQSPSDTGPCPFCTFCQTCGGAHPDSRCNDSPALEGDEA